MMAISTQLGTVQRTRFGRLDLGTSPSMPFAWKAAIQRKTERRATPSILYENRIVIFKEKRLTFPTDFSELGFIEFEQDQLVAELGPFIKELVELDILEVRAKG